MIDEKRKMTAQGSSVGADDGQSISHKFQDHYTRPGRKKQFPGKK